MGAGGGGGGGGAGWWWWWWEGGWGGGMKLKTRVTKTETKANVTDSVLVQFLFIYHEAILGLDKINDIFVFIVSLSRCVCPSRFASCS